MHCKLQDIMSKEGGGGGRDLFQWMCIQQIMGRVLDGNKTCQGICVKQRASSDLYTSDSFRSSSFVHVNGGCKNTVCDM